jgi:hypothetical protein
MYDDASLSDVAAGIDKMVRSVLSLAKDRRPRPQPAPEPPPSFPPRAPKPPASPSIDPVRRPSPSSPQRR